MVNLHPEMVVNLQLQQKEVNWTHEKEFQFQPPRLKEFDLYALRLCLLATFDQQHCGPDD